MLIQYLQLVLGFNTSDQSLLIVSLGAANLIVQVGVEHSPHCIVTAVAHELSTVQLVG